MVVFRLEEANRSVLWIDKEERDVSTAPNRGKTMSSANVRGEPAGSSCEGAKTHGAPTYREN